MEPVPAVIVRKQGGVHSNSKILFHIVYYKLRKICDIELYITNIYTSVFKLIDGLLKRCHDIATVAL